LGVYGISGATTASRPAQLQQALWEYITPIVEINQLADHNIVVLGDLFLTVHPHCRDGSGARRTPALVGLHLRVPCRRCPADGQPPASPGTSRVSLEPHAVATQTSVGNRFFRALAPLHAGQGM